MRSVRSTHPVGRRRPVAVFVDDRVLPHVVVGEWLDLLDGFLEPFVFVARVVRHEVQEHLDACEQNRAGRFSDGRVLDGTRPNSHLAGGTRPASVRSRPWFRTGGRSPCSPICRNRSRSVATGISATATPRRRLCS